jgi:hypothetical protein
VAPMRRCDQRELRGRRLFWLVGALVAATLLAGCTPEPSTLYVPTWTLVVRGHEDEAVALPAHVNAKLFDETGARVPTYALVARVPIPPELRGRELTFAVPTLATRAALFVDGHPAVPHALPSFAGYREPGARAWHILPDDSDTALLDVSLEIDDTWIASGWLDTVPRISATLDGDPWTIVVDRLNRAAAALALAGAGAAALTYGALFAFDRRRRGDGIVALGCLGGAAYATFALGIAQGVLGRREPIVLGLVVVAGIAALATSIVRSKARPRAGLVAAAVVATALSAADVAARLGLGEIWYGLHLACAGIALLVATRAFSDLREHARTFTAAGAPAVP